MNILILTTHLNPGGISRYVINLAKGLNGQKHNVWVASSGGKWVDKLKSTGANYKSIPINTKSIGSIKILLSFLRLRVFVSRKKIDIIHGNTRVTQFLGFLIYKLLGIPYVSAFHGFYRPSIFRKLFKFSGIMTIAVSKAVKNHLIKDLRMNENKIRVVYNGIDKQGFSAKGDKRHTLGFAKGDCLVGILGRISEEKGHFLAAEAVKELSSKYKNIYFLISGKGKLKEKLKSYIKVLKIEQRVKFLNCSADRFLDIIDLLLVPSKKEGFGYSVIEAFIKEVPVIGYNIGGIAEIINDRKNGILFYSYNGLVLAEAIEEVIFNEDLRKGIIARAKKDVLSFSLERMAVLTGEVYKETEKRRILVVNVNWLGDAVLTTPVFEAMKERFPFSYIGVLAVDGVKEVFDNNPYIDEVIIFKEKKRRKGALSGARVIFLDNIFYLKDFIKFLRKKNFDTVFFIHRSFTRAVICLLAGIRIRAGYRRLKNLFVLTRSIKPPEGLIHRQDYYLYLFEKEGILVKNKSPRFFIPGETRKRITGRLDSLREKYSYLVGINPSANWKLKRWPADYFAGLSDFLIKDLNCAVIFVGAEKEESVIEEVRQKMRQQSYSFCGKTTLKELGALMKNMELFISNDSGPAHLAASLDVNTLVLFGPTSEKITSPRGKFVRIIKKDVGCKTPCYNLDCRDNICMKNISIDEVYSEAKKILLNTGTKKIEQNRKIK